MPHDPLAELEASRRREGYGPLAAAFALALAIHVLMVPLFSFVFGERARSLKPGGALRGATLVQLSRAEWEKNKRIEIELKSPEERERDGEKRKMKEDDDVVAPGQIVSLPPPRKQERPDFADYAAEHEQRTDRETRSRDQQQRPAALASRLVPGLISGSASALPPRDGQSSEAREDRASGPTGPGRSLDGDSGTDLEDGAGTRMFALEIPKQTAREPLKLKFDPHGFLENREAVPEIPGNGEQARVALGPTKADAARKPGSGSSGNATGQGMRGGGNGTEGLPNLAQLTPPPDKLAQLAGAPANDYLPEVEVDAETRLNAWRWKHATFFNRVADAIRREWQGGEVLQQNDPGGRVYGFEERMTVVQVTLDRGGNVLDVNVQSPSGAMPLDDEAVRAFKQAGPFANPPPQLFKGGDRFTFLFGFNVSYNRSNFDLRWRPD